MPLLVVTSERFGHHLTPPGHPERVERAQVLEGVAIGWRERGGASSTPRAATDDELRAVHAPRPRRAIAETAGPRRDARPRHLHLARLATTSRALAAGAVLAGVDHTLAGDGPALALVRPPGHHAERDRAMGFCLFNNVAVAAAYARARGLGARRHRRLRRPSRQRHAVDVLRRSRRALRLDAPVPVLPGHRRGDGDRARARASARTVNVPLEAGATDADYELVFRAVRRAGAARSSRRI